MKPASIISLIVAVLISVAGLVTCIVAQNMAQASGQNLFSEIKTDGDHTRSIDLTEADINKIQLIFSNAEVTVHGNSEKSYIEFINFKDNYYSLTSTSSLVSFDETPDITSMLMFWENGFSFKGIRYILNFNKDNEPKGDKEIHIYLTADKNVKQIDIQATSCTVNITNMTTSTDYLITADEVTLNTNHINTTSAVAINSGKDISPAKKVVYNSTGDYVTNLTVNAVELDMKAEGFMCTGSANINYDKGDVTITSVGGMQFKLESDDGKITVNSVKESSPCTVGTTGGAVSVTTKSGNINVTTGAINTGNNIAE
ncbi:MAG: DUF4097 domain-containing protein [Ruminococcaceae bacterium]|nr:DUF4097 domain-containing protein [Oscillospiraceae bacterium]